MSRKTLYVSDGLVYNGRAYDRGDVIALDHETEQLLLESGQVTTTEPAPYADPTIAAAAAPVTLSEYSDEELLAEVESRGLIGDGGTVDYGSLDKPDLEQLVAEREIEVEGTGSKGAVTKDDLVKALSEADAASDD